VSLKRFAVKGMIILGVVIFLCFFFSGTIQTISTPKVRLTQATTGRLEVKVERHADVYYPDAEEIIPDGVKEMNIKVTDVLVRAGQYVEAGDVIVKAEVTGYDDAMKKLEDDMATKQTELADLDRENRKLPKTSRQNDLYEEMLDAQTVLSDAKYEVRKIAAKAGVKLTDDESTWDAQLKLARLTSDEVKTAMEAVDTANAAYEEAVANYNAVAEDKKLRVKDDTFKYIQSRNKLLKEIDELSGDMLDLEMQRDSLQEIKAPHAGWVTAVNVKRGDTCDGSAAVYSLTAADAQPSLQCTWEDKDRTVPEGTRVDIKLDDDETVKGSVTENKLQADGTRKLTVAFPDDMASEINKTIGELTRSGGTEVDVIFKQKSSSTLLPAAAVREDGDNAYVYVAQYSYGGFMSGGTGMKAVKTAVTVIDRNDTQVAVEESLSWQDIAYQEDRALSDGCRIMEYVN